MADPPRPIGVLAMNSLGQDARAWSFYNTGRMPVPGVSTTWAGCPCHCKMRHYPSLSFLWPFSAREDMGKSKVLEHALKQKKGGLSVGFGHRGRAGRGGIPFVKSGNMSDSGAPVGLPPSLSALP